MRKKYMWWLILGVVILAAVLWGPIVSNVEQPKYKVIERDGDIEIRDYASMIIAEVDVSGERDKAINEGFRMIADYIFGNNISSQKVAMTAPVTQQASEKIAMTSPVTQQGERNAWQVRFVMPASYTMQTLPKPKTLNIKLKEIDRKRFAVIKFSGIASENSLKLQTANLTEYLSKKKLTAINGPTYAFYNPPWTLPLLRRNEVMVEIVTHPISRHPIKRP